LPTPMQNFIDSDRAKNMVQMPHRFLYNEIFQSNRNRWQSNNSNSFNSQREQRNFFNSVVLQGLPLTDGVWQEYIFNLIMSGLFELEDIYLR